MLFKLLNRIDGIDPDADVTFVLTTNRVEALERVLVDRLDLAVESLAQTRPLANKCCASTRAEPPSLWPA